MTSAPDPRPAQIRRTADFMERHPDGCTAPELDKECDPGSPTKVISEMKRLGYGIAYGIRRVPCRFGEAKRRRRTYVLTHRPPPERQLALLLE